MFWIGYGAGIVTVIVAVIAYAIYQGKKHGS